MSGQNGKIVPREVVFGERYEDNSGYAWRVALIDNGLGDLVLEFGDNERLKPLDVTVRDIADAFHRIADLLGEPA